MKKSTKRWLSLALTLVMLVGMVPAFELTARAVATVNTWETLRTALAAGDEIRLVEDVTAGDGDSALTVPSGKTATLDLNGHTIDANNKFSVLTVEGSLTLNDTSEAGSGKLTGGNNRYGGGVDVKAGATFTMSGGSITGNNGGYGGGVSGYGTFTMTGGSITGNTATGYGGGVIDNGTFTMSGGEITGNTANQHGGGVYFFNGTFQLTGGSITDNTATQNGGGVYVYYGTFTMTGGSIAGNTATKSGGGMYIDGGTFTMSGGEITGNTANTANTATNNGGGVCFNKGTFQLTGGRITDNKKSDQPNNVYLNSKKITVTGTLAEGTQIGVNNNTATVFTSDLSGNGTINNFFSDSDNFGIGTVNGEAKLVAKYTVTFNPDNGEETFTQKVVEGGTATEPEPAPTKEGYTLKGWKLNADDESYFNFATPITSDITLTAVWDEVKVYTVTFNPDNGEGTSTQYVEEGGKATEPVPAPTKEGYTFKGWKLNGADYDFDTAVNADITLTAAWEINKYTVKFVDEDGTTVLADAQEVEYNGTATKPANPTRDGYTLKGWQLNGADYDFNTPVTADITLTAVWEEQTFTVTSDNGTGAYTNTYPKYYPLKLSAPATNAEGKKFSHWADAYDNTTILSYSNEYSLLVRSDVNAVAVYVDDDPVQDAIVKLSFEQTMNAAGTKKAVRMTASRTAPEDWTFVESGIEYTTNKKMGYTTNDNANLLGGSEVDVNAQFEDETKIIRKKTTTASTKVDGDYYFSLVTGNSVDLYFYARAYATFKNSAGDTVTVYDNGGAVTAMTYNNISVV